MVKTLKSSILAATAISGGLLLQANPARAVVVTVAGNQWEISSFTGNYDNDRSKFADLPVGEMPWWGSESLATLFQAEYSAKPGSDNSLFAFQLSQQNIGGYFLDFVNAVGPSGVEANFTNADKLYAIASFVPSPPPASVPGPLPILGAAAAFRASRCLRQRIPGSPTQV